MILSSAIYYRYYVVPNLNASRVSYRSAYREGAEILFSLSHFFRELSLHAQATCHDSTILDLSIKHIETEYDCTISNTDFLIGSKPIAKMFRNEPHIYVIMN